MLVSVVVAVRSAVFCIVWSLLMFVLEAVDNQMMRKSSMIGLVMTIYKTPIVLYVVTIVSFGFPQVVDVKAFSNYVILVAFSFVLSMCWLYVSLGSKLNPKICGC